MGLVILIILIVLILFLDNKRYKTFYTPSILLGAPFLIICLLYIQFSNKIGFYSLNFDVLYIWVFGLLLFWIIGNFTFLIFNKPKKLKILSSNNEDSIIVFYNKYILNIVFFLSLILIFTLKEAYSIYIVSGGEKVEEYLSNGIQGHLINIIKFLSIISFLSFFWKLSKWSKLKNAFILIVSISLSILYGTKSGILILIISYYIAWSIYFNKKVKLTHVVLGISFGFLVFLLSYSLLFGRIADFDFILEHMIMYYVSGLASMNAYFISNGPVGIEPELLFRTYFNILNLISGNGSEIKNVISNEWTFIGNGTSINVKTFFGTIYLYGGLFYGIIAVSIFSFLSHFLFAITKKYPSNILALSLYAYILATFCFGWFDFYLNTIFVFEYIILALLLNLVANTKKSS